MENKDIKRKIEGKRKSKLFHLFKYSFLKHFFWSPNMGMSYMFQSNYVFLSGDLQTLNHSLCLFFLLATR